MELDRTGVEIPRTPQDDARLSSQISRSSSCECPTVKLKMDGRDHYLCCRSCEKLYVERYEKIKAAAK